MSELAHAKFFGASSASRWMSCPGSAILSKDLPDTSSKYAEEGTLAHSLAAVCLVSGEDARAHVGTEIDGSTITPDMAQHVQTYLDNVRERTAGHEVRVEQRVDFGLHLEQPGAFGTADVLALSADGSTLKAIDFKYGMGVPVYAEENPQLMLYALGALERYELVANITHVVLEIHQPRLQHLDSWEVGIDGLLAFAEKAKLAAQRVVEIDVAGVVKADDLVDGDHCRWCKAKATCPKLSASVQTAVGGFEDLSEKTTLEKVSDFTLANLAQAMSSVDLVEQWCSAVRAEVERKLLAGDSVAGWKLVQGKRGNRDWIDAAEAETFLRKACRHDEIYKSVLLSPTQIEKRTQPWIDAAGDTRKPILGPRQMKTFTAMVTQTQGKPSVAPESDKRPALAALKFEALTGADDLC